MICPKCHREIPDDAALCCYCGRKFVVRVSRRTRPNGTGTAVRRGNGWRAVVVIGWKIMPDGHRVPDYRTKSGFPTKKAALEYCPILLKQDQQDRKTAPRLFAIWETYRAGELGKLSDSKQTAYTIAWKKLKELHDYPVDQITVQMLRAAVSNAAPTYYTAKDCKVLLTHLFRLAAADGWVSKDLPSFILLPELQEKERTPFSDLEQAALWRLYEAGNQDAALPLLMIYTGMMPGEVVSMTPAMIRLNERQIVGAGLKTKTRKESPVFLPEAILPLLEAAIADPRHPFWLTDEKAFYRHYYAALEAASTRRLEPYCCRHTTATALAVTENIAPQTVRKLMRWSTTRMLDRYAHPDDADALAAANRLTRQKQA